MNNKPVAPPTRHLAILTEYDGTAFNGWQSQALGRTVQQTLAHALAELTGEADLVLYGSSRTDAGVHARGHVSHFRTTSRIPATKLPLAMNSHLPDDLSVQAAVEVAADFHAQYHAIGKIYTYRIWNHATRPAIDRNRVCHVPVALDLALMRQALPALVGRHNYAAFRDTGSIERNPVRTLQDVALAIDGPRITLTFQGDGFLYHMVRILAGTLVAVGQGKLPPDAVTELLISGERKLAGKTMPPEGLCLERVLYDPPLFDEFFQQTGQGGDFHG